MRMLIKMTVTMTAIVERSGLGLLNDISDRANDNDGSSHYYDDNYTDPLVIPYKDQPSNDSLSITEENVYHYISGDMEKNLMRKICNQCTVVIAGLLQDQRSRFFF